MVKKDFLCPCHSQRLYKDCCKPFHEKAFCSNALELMRSRYSAYALVLADYIIKTTHPLNPAYSLDPEWKKQILEFCRSTIFEDLQILEFIPGEKEAFVTFRAILKQKNKDVSFSETSFTETSFFIKENGRWFYRNGEIKN